MLNDRKKEEPEELVEPIKGELVRILIYDSTAHVTDESGWSFCALGTVTVISFTVLSLP